MAFEINKNFRKLDGGLFSEVTKADVGDGIGKLINEGYTIMSWADPFFPDPVLPCSIRTVLQKEISESPIVHYSMPIGLTECREAVAARIRKKYGVSLDPARNILITPGSDSGLLYAMMAFINEGDEVIVFEPSYPSNFLNVEMCGGKVVSVPLHEEKDYRFDPDELYAACTPKTRMVVLTHPNNPSGAVMRRDQLEILCRFIVDNDLILVCDQAFEDHIYDGIEFVMPAFMEGMWERTLTVFSLSKGYGLSGFRVGYILGEDHLMNTLYGGAVNFLGATNTLAQKAAIAAMEDETILPAYTEILRKRRDMICDALRDIPGVKLTIPESGILLWLNVSELGTGAEVSEYILKNAKVSVNDGKFYGAGEGEGHVRIVYSCYEDEGKANKAYMAIAEALKKLAAEKNAATRRI